MVIDLLVTKIRIPPGTRHEVDRARLVEDLEAAILVHKVTLLSTPAGYGRTTVLAQWARQSGADVVWYTMGLDDKDPERFFRYLVTAWGTGVQRVREHRLTALLAGMHPDMEEVQAAIINVGAELDRDTVFVLDDVHFLDNDDIVHALAFLIDHLPPTMHVVLSGRAMPALPLARYRARGELADFGEDDLRFRPREAAKFLREAMELDIDDLAVANLYERLEGWVAGLQLAALSLRKGSMPGPASAPTGRQRFIADYIREDVLAALPEDVSRFLLQTSVLDRLEGSLCNAVTGRHDSQPMLEQLERMNLFIHPLDENGVWYRYHRLFADVLKEELARGEPGLAFELHRRAARWYLDNGFSDAALRHAIEADDDEIGVAIFDKHVNELLNTGQFRQLQVWLASLPDRWKDTYPFLGLAEAGLLLFSGALDAGMHLIEDIERRLQDPGNPDAEWQQARVQAVRCFLSCFKGDLDAANYWAEQSLARLREGDVSYRVDIYHALGDSYRTHGRWDEAEAMYRKTLEVARGRMPTYYEPHVFGALADMELQRGNLRAAHGYWTTALASIRKQENFGLLDYPLIGWVYIRMGELAYEWNDMEAARQYLEQGRQSAELGGDIRWRAAAAFLTAQLGMAGGDMETAAGALGDAASLLAGAAFPDWSTRLERLRLDVCIRRGEFDHAVRRGRELASDPAGRFEPVAAQLAAARTLVAAGSATPHHEAEGYLEDVLRVAAEQGRDGVRIEALAVQAMLQQRVGSEAAAMLSLEEALRLGVEEGYIRTFVDLGVPMIRLLHAARSRRLMPDYVDRLLAASGEHALEQEGFVPTLSEPLTPRELEVLRRIAAGLTNEEIADGLFISAETVKKHASSIFGKLGVGNRTEAAARARDLGLLEKR